MGEILVSCKATFYAEMRKLFHGKILAYTRKEKILHRILGSLNWKVEEVFGKQLTFTAEADEFTVKALKALEKVEVKERELEKLLNMPLDQMCRELIAKTLVYE